jgi:hypothetical protein
VVTDERIEMSDSYILDITWHKDVLARFVGPFASQNEAEEWGRLNIPSGSFEVSILEYPYLRTRT